MSNVLEFRPASAGGPAPGRSTHASGEIVIFPGVRYERTADAGPAPGPSRGGGRAPKRSGQKSR